MDADQLSQDLELNLLRAKRLRDTALELLQMADEISAQATVQGVEFPNFSEEQERPEGRPAFFARSRRELLIAATDTYRLRRQRDRYFPAQFFGEPAWDMLLDLYIHDAQGKPISVSSACIASAVPPTTALRWLRILEEQGYVTRAAKHGDSRVIYVHLTDLARRSIDAFLTQSATHLEASSAPQI